ncbi:MAG: hypothetical protein J6J36_07215 [Clostridia bacterium]|nr:hypothetical protein [Clostridia bacterium]
MNIMISCCEKDSKAYSNLLAFDSNINVESTTSTEKSTLQQFFEKKPDILILDLTNKNLNALYVLSKLSEKSTDSYKKVILIADDSCSNFINQSNFADVLSKPITTQKLIGSLYKNPLPISKTITEQDVKKLLLRLKIDLYSTGIHFLIRAILMAAENHKLLQNLQDIYEKIGKERNISYEKVKWSVRSSVETINKYSNPDTFKTIFKYYDDTRSLTPKYFIKLVLYYFDIDADE